MPSKTIINRAINACKKSKCDHTLAAVLYKGGSVLRVACNDNKTLQYRKRYFAHGEPSRHAEMNVLHGMPRDVIVGCSMLVVRINKRNQIMSAKPCHACAMALYDSGVRRVYYSSYSGEILKLDFGELLNGNYSKEYL